MTARNKQELASAIDAIFNSTAEPVDTAEKGVNLRKKIAEKLANEIDAYVQFQIGTRLSAILRAVNAGDTSGNPIPITAGPDFASFTRTS